MWERLELSEVGIPRLSKDNMSKVVFTTRSQQVCDSMKAQKIVVSCLPPNQAFNLFRSIVGEEMLDCHPELMGLVQDVVRECKGLPLALFVIGRSMIGSTDAQDWKDAKMMLAKYPSDMVEVKGEVFPKLLFSYDRLPTLTLQKCFECCSLYPEDHYIKKDDVIMLWIAERLIDADDSMNDALGHGRRIIKNLVQAGLLEVGNNEGIVRMHDVIRDMSLWLACERGEKKNKIWVEVPDDISVTPNYGMAKWRTNIEKVSLWGRRTTMESSAGLSFCSNLVTLIVRDTELRELPGEIFVSMKVLKVLDLSRNRILKSLPGEIGDLANLEYLNTVQTDVITLPVKVKQLKKLRFFMVSAKTIIPRTVISSLRFLLTFEQDGSFYSDGDKDHRRSMEEGMLEELEGLEHIMHLRLVLISASGVHKLLESSKLQSVTRHLHLFTGYSPPAEFDLGTLTKHLETLCLRYCGSSVIKLGRSFLCSNISEVYFYQCGRIRNLNSLLYVTNLSILEVSSCESVEELIREDAEEIVSSRDTNVGVSLFSRLTVLDLADLLEWESQATKDAFTPKFSGPF